MDRRLTHEDLDWLRKMSGLKVANRPPRGIPTSVARKLTKLGYVEARPGGENWEQYSIVRKGRAELADRLCSTFRLLALAPFGKPANSRPIARPAHAGRRSVAARSFPGSAARTGMKCRDRNARAANAHS